MRQNKENHLEEKELIEKGRENFYNELIDESEKCFKKAIEMNENSMPANFYLGHIYQIKRELKKAKEKFDLVIHIANEILRKDPQNLEAHYFLGAAYGGKALQEYNPLFALKFQRIFFPQMEKVLSINPNHWEALWLKGRGLGLIGKFEDAISCLKKAIEIMPLGDMWVDLALIYLNLRDYESAEKCLKEAKELKPQSPTIYYNLHLVYQAKNEKEKAKQCKRKCEELLKHRNKGAESGE